MSAKNHSNQKKKKKTFSNAADILDVGSDKKQVFF